jgi:branched-chain amino acid transport system permease protein
VGAIRLARSLISAVLVAGAVAAPFLASDFTLFQISLAACLGTGVLGLKLLAGYNGQLSLGHSVFFAVGAYTIAILVDRGVDFHSTLPLAAAVSFLVGFALGWPALRIRGHGLAVVTLVIALATPQIAGASLLEPLTGGREGIGLPHVASPVAGLSEDQWLYIVVVGVAAALWLAAILIVNSRFGRAMQASRDQETAATAVGVNVAAVNSLTFGVSAAYAGLAGGMMAAVLHYVGPESFELIIGLGLFVAVLITGQGWLGGAFLGGLFLQFLPSWAEDLSTGVGLPEGLTWAIYGGALLIAVYAQILGGRRRFRSLGPERGSGPQTQSSERSDAP